MYLSEMSLPKAFEKRLLLAFIDAYGGVFNFCQATYDMYSSVRGWLKQKVFDGGCSYLGVYTHSGCYMEMLDMESYNTMYLAYMYVSLLCGWDAQKQYTQVSPAAIGFAMFEEPCLLEDAYIKYVVYKRYASGSIPALKVHRTNHPIREPLTPARDIGFVIVRGRDVTPVVKELQPSLRNVDMASCELVTILNGMGVVPSAPPCYEVVVMDMDTMTEQLYKAKDIVDI